MNSKSIRLGMSISSASNRLNRDLIYKLATDLGLMVCYRCGGSVSRDKFSIDHKVDWLKSDNPIETFFDLSNVAFSHHRCNSSASSGKFQPGTTFYQKGTYPSALREHNEARESPKCGTESGYCSGCKCDKCKRAHANYMRHYRIDPARRDKHRRRERERYRRSAGIA